MSMSVTISMSTSMRMSMSVGMSTSVNRCVSIRLKGDEKGKVQEEAEDRGSKDPGSKAQGSWVRRYP